MKRQFFTKVIGQNTALHLFFTIIKTHTDEIHFFYRHKYFFNLYFLYAVQNKWRKWCIGIE